MPEREKKTFAHREVAEILVTKADIHEGHWGLFIEFGLGAANIPVPGPGVDLALKPAAIVSVNTIGIQKFDEPNQLTVDAATVNPKTQGSGRSVRPRKKASR